MLHQLTEIYTTKAYTAMQSTIKNIQHEGLYRKGFLSHATYFADNSLYRKVDNIRGIKKRGPLKWYEKNKPFSSHRKKFDKGGSGKHRTIENLQEIGSLTIDIDYNGPEPLYFQNILALCKGKGIPEPSYVIKTPSHNHFQVIWAYPYIKKNKLSWWRNCAEALCEAFKRYNPDITASCDPTRLVRNPYYINAEIAYESNHELTLSLIYEALKDAGFIKLKPPGSRKRRARQVSFSKSLERMEHFFRDHGTFKGTHSEIYSSLGIPKATYYVLLKRLKRAGKLQIQTIRNGKTWVSEMGYFHGLRKEYLNRGAPLFYSELLSSFNSGGVAWGVRNRTVFVLGLLLRIGGLGEYEIAGKLGRGLEFCKAQGRGFDDNEIETTIRSACRARYKYLVSFKKLREWGISEALFGNDLDSQKLNLDCEHSEVCDCDSCCGNVGFSIPFDSLNAG